MKTVELRHPVKKGERWDVPVEERFDRLARICLHKAAIRLQQVRAKELDLLPHARDATTNGINHSNPSVFCCVVTFTD